MSPQLDSVNTVNAPIVARERNIGVSETKRERCTDYHTLIRVTVTTDQSTRTLTGSLFGGDKPRLVGIDDVAVEAELSPRMLFTRNEDKPGYIGRLGAMLGDAGINIATFHLGRTAPGADAVALVSVDQAVDGALLEKILRAPGVVAAVALTF